MSVERLVKMSKEELKNRLDGPKIEDWNCGQILDQLADTLTIIEISKQCLEDNIGNREELIDILKTGEKRLSELYLKCFK